ncbi:MAG: adenosylcobalamin-dependent ribonucleoside-diphosphate reductase [Phycisphaerae bacterium]
MTSAASGIAITSYRDEEPPLTENACSVLEARYLKKNEAGECTETPGGLFRRVARTVAEVEFHYGATEAERRTWERAFYQLMASGSFLPNSPTLMNAGREMGMLSACFVLPVRDSITDIFDSIKHTALIQKAGGGTGFAFDELRPTGDYIRSSGGTTSGPISFWRAFSEATNAIQQGAFRRGANMGMMYIHHPDILKFLHAKQDLDQFTNYNISVKVTDSWMRDFLEDPDSPHVVRNPRTGQACVLPRDLDIRNYDLRQLVQIDCVEPVPDRDSAAYYSSPRLTGELPEELRGRVYSKRDIWDIIVENAWQSGEPGVVFIDRINEHNPTPHLGRIEATNPCGEQPLLPYEACNLGSINLGKFVTGPCSPAAAVDWEALKRVVHLSTRFLDNVIDANNYPLPEIEAICKANRKIGLGIMGFADALYKLGVAYDSDEGVAWGARFMRFVNDESHDYSEHLARIRGCFPNWQGSIWQAKHSRLMRNAATSTVAPTGTISIIANCSGGIEPLFSLAFMRNVLYGQRQTDEPLVEVNETFRSVAEQRGLQSEQLFERLARDGTLRHIDQVPQDIKKVFVCAHDIAPGWHMRMQAAFQAHCDSSISKTINFPRSASYADVEKIYRLAFELRCKGVTVYRDGCRGSQPMALKCDDHEQEDVTEMPGAAVRESGDPVATGLTRTSRRGNGDGNGNGHGRSAGSAPAGPRSVGTVIPVPPRIEPQDLPEIVSGLRIRQMTPFGNMHVKITVDPRGDRELEVFAQLGKGGDVATSDLEAICRMISLWLRSGGSLRHVIKQLSGIGSSLQIPTRAGRIMSLGDGLATALKKYVRAKERFGLRSLLLGEIDLAELDNPPAPHTPVRAPADRTLQSKPASGCASPRDRRSGKSGRPRLLATAEMQAEVAEGCLDAPRAVAGLGEDACAAECVADESSSASAATDGSAATAVAEPLETAAVVTDDGGRATESEAVASVGAVSTSVAELDDAGQARAALAAGGRVLEQHDTAAHYKLKCPECGGALVVQEGCGKCHACGWSAC